MDIPVFHSSQTYLAPFDQPIRLMFHRQTKTYHHYHDYYELVVVLEGKGEHCVFDQGHRITSGDVLVLKPGMSHCYRNPRGLILANVMFEGQVLEELPPDLYEIPGYYTLFKPEPEFKDFKSKYTLDNEQLQEVKTLLQRIEQEEVRKAPGYRFAVLVLFQQLILYLARSYNDDEKKHSRRMVKLSRMVKFIEENFERDISREEIIAQAGVSISVGSRIFQEFLHESPIEHLIRARLGHASELLLRTDLPVSEIAFRCGFRDSNYFSTLFKKKTGISPRKYAGRNADTAFIPWSPETPK